MEPKKELAINALLTSDAAAAAKESGVQLRTLQKWLATDAAFRGELARARSELRTNVIHRLRARALRATDVLAEIMEDESASARARVTAAKALLVAALEADTDIDDRLAELEDRLLGEGFYAKA